MCKASFPFSTSTVHHWFAVPLSFVLVLLYLATGQVVRLEVPILRVVGSYPTQWTSTYVLVGSGWLNKPLRPPGLVDTISRWKNGPTHAVKSSVYQLKIVWAHYGTPLGWELLFNDDKGLKSQC